MWGQLCVGSSPTFSTNILLIKNNEMKNIIKNNEMKNNIFISFILVCTNLFGSAEDHLLLIQSSIDNIEGLSSGFTLQFFNNSIILSFSTDKPKEREL